MLVTITLRTGNAAFVDNGEDVEAARILRRLADKIEGNPYFPAEGYSMPLLDMNGGEVGYMVCATA